MNKVFKTFYEALFTRGTNSNKSVTLIDTKEDIKVSYKELFKKAYALKEKLKDMDVQKGDEVIICYATPLEFISSYWACILGGFIAVPISLGNTAQHKNKTLKIYKLLNSPFLLMPKNYLRDVTVQPLT